MANANSTVTPVRSDGHPSQAASTGHLSEADVRPLLYEHDDGRYAVADIAELADFCHGDPAWHRMGPVDIVRRRGNQPVGTADSINADKLSDQLGWAERLVSEVTEDIRAVAFGALEMLRSGDRIDCVYTSITVMAQMADTLASHVQSIAEDCGIEVKIDETAWNDASVALRRWEAVDHVE